MQLPLYIALALVGLLLIPSAAKAASCKNKECPDGTTCVEREIESFTTPSDSSQVVCKKIEEKPGSCPEETGQDVVCIVKCNTDSECLQSQKCCGGCPKECRYPVF